ncbi:hypothetical protein [Tenggerimyces flavus]|uniref:Uncharacterized protein n=1 Tax=Tenggerimyces flavus TaxID=1708749 RepID=A0ABV7Y7Y5_9ACTN|nr:hypothetical protein [Tenggerimyces flavus]MBM7786652.1 hypothetical protein [Tenggerimyces flavus]
MVVRRMRSGVVAATVLALVAALALATAPGAVAEDRPEQSTMPALEAVETSYPEDAAARDFNTGPAGWSFAQDYATGCWARARACPKIAGDWQTDGGQLGDGDGYLRFRGNATSVGSPWGEGSYADWTSPWFTYTSRDAQSWAIAFDWRSSKGDYTLGWNGLRFELRDLADRVVRTVVPGTVAAPTGDWRQLTVPFDGRGAFAPGKRYRIHAVAIDYSGPSAATLGNQDVDNVTFTTSTAPSPVPIARCAAERDLSNGVSDAAIALLSGAPGSLCQSSEPLHDGGFPAAKLADNLAKAPGLGDVVRAGAGAFTVVDVASGQTGAWAVGAPSGTPQRFYAWVGRSSNVAVFFATYQPQRVVDRLMNGNGTPPAAATGVIQDQLGDNLAAPVGEVMIDPSWTPDNAIWHVATALARQGLPNSALPIPAGSDGLVELPDVGVPELPAAR